MTFLRVSSVAKYYEQKTVFREISFESEASKLIQIIGENGAGKSTLLRIVSGLLRPDQGQVHLIEKNLYHALHFETLKKEVGIGYFNSASQLYAHLNIKENLRLLSALNEVDFQTALPLAERLRIDNALDLFPDECSSGTLKKFAILRSCIHKPKLWLLDEPFVHLDNASLSVVSQLIIEAVHAGALVLLVSHSEYSFAEFNIKEEKIFLKDGKLTPN